MTKQQQAQLNQRLKLSKEDVAYEVLGFYLYPITNISNKINIGYIIPYSIDKMIVDITQHYILHISKILLERQSATLKEVLNTFPLKKGIPELLTYFSIASESEKHIIENKNKELVVISETENKTISIPRVIYTK